MEMKYSTPGVQRKEKICTLTRQRVGVLEFFSDGFSSFLSHSNGHIKNQGQGNDRENIFIFSFFNPLLVFQKEEMFIPFFVLDS
ncbi:MULTISPECIES: hypothetical protein [Pontibacillus]|uniref:Uncharacterized protein n=1 Tax=Pontibacillus chungwhensis TaxID=265426 RepID=A0ABY8UTE3_9BACI|nr:MULTISPECIES: hypothetical protein [Pontibacillus]MCD5323087.1 hypothetical protein [Pontibacillus sp. HN14]WIF96478.1 hypothetical protein QNI29_12015 [Pontibacillus chungwhensis]